MGSVAARFTKLWRFPGISRPVSSFEVGIQGSSKLCYSTVSDVEATEKDGKNNNEAQDDDFFVAEIPELQSVDPRRGRRFRGVHKEKKKKYKGLLIHYLSWRVVGEVESSFSLGALSSFGNYMEDWITKLVGTLSNGGMFDQRIEGARDLPRPAQWHRIAVHNEHLGAYAVQQLVKNSPVYVEGDIETRVFNDSINGEAKNIPEICVRYDGKLHLVKTGESISSINFEELREGLL